MNLQTKCQSNIDNVNRHFCLEIKGIIYERGRIMIKRISILLLVVTFLFCMGCAKTDPAKKWSTEKGHIYRNDLELDDFAFLFDDCGYEPGVTSGLDIYEGFRDKIFKPNDIFNALGLPGSTTGNFGVKEYRYVVGKQCDAITIEYSPFNDCLDFYPTFSDISEEYFIEQLATGKKTIDPNQYKMNKRFDITDDELSFIGENTTSDEIQQALGAPHSFIETYDVKIEDLYGNVFIYGLKNGKVFKVSYFRQGNILRAWIEDSDGNEIKLFIDREASSFYEKE